jgi:hypothetical protein
MINRYRDEIREAIKYRRQMKLPKTFFIITFITIFTLAYILLSVVLIPSKVVREYNFLSEAGSITVLSAVFLSMGSAFSMASVVMYVRKKSGNYWLWVIATFGLAFMAFDELLGFHEQADRLIGKFISPGVFRGWNDIIVILYGVIAFLIAVILIPKLLKNRMVIEMFAIGFLFYAVHTLIDSIIEPRTMLSTIFEESAKLLSVEFIALGAFIGFLGLLWNFSPPD